MSAVQEYESAKCSFSIMCSLESHMSAEVTIYLQRGWKSAAILKFFAYIAHGNLFNIDLKFVLDTGAAQSELFHSGEVINLVDIDIVPLVSV